MEEIEVPFPKTRLTMDVTTNASEAQMEKGWPTCVASAQFP